ncbi:hypothetical protein ACH5RR_007897 [Cinchona calisaya]|uniref:Exocyst subunit Exo70 family protein n=1 Tax=Cinchona calisaya TaxID=153742 RepID=A0ABD3A9V4_9GENT
MEKGTMNQNVDQLKADFHNLLQNDSARKISVTTSGNAEDQLRKDFQSILQVIGATSLKNLSSTTCSSSLSIRSLSVDEDSAGYHMPSGKDLHELRYIAETLNSVGYLDKLISVYVSERKATMNAHLKRLGIQKLSINEIQRLELEPLRLKTMRWTRAMHFCLVMFSYERQLSRHIFEGLGNATDELSLTETLRDPATQLLEFAEALSRSRRSPERLKTILLLFKSLSSHIRDTDSVFPSELAKTIRTRGSSILSRLVEAARLTLLDFEDAVLNEKSSTAPPVPGGTVHHLTKYVMDYISLILDSKDILEVMIITKPSMVLGESTVPDLERILELESQSPLAIHVVWIIVTLRHKLEGKSKYYQDASLALLFIMNNVHYIVQCIKQSSELTEMVGNNYQRKLIQNIQQATTSYLRSTWERVLDCLKDEGLYVSHIFYSGVSKKILKGRFKTFNCLIEDIQRNQVMWAVPDRELREKLLLSILDKLIRSYRTFLGQFRSQIEKGKLPKKSIKYSEEQLETIVRSLFSFNCSL